MPCFHPLEGWFDVSSGERKGRPLMRFPIGEDPLDWEYSTLRCRRCLGCRSDRARDLSLRAQHEAQHVGCSSFLTLTYSDEHLPHDAKGLRPEHDRYVLTRPQVVRPYGGSLRRRDYELFLKRLRERLRLEFGARVRAYGVGEYGGRTVRPHYHVCLFGFDFLADRVPAGKSKMGHPMFSSKLLDESWGLGKCWLNLMGREVASYAAKYALKSLGPRYELRRLIDGRVVEVEPCFDSLPRGGGALGVPWLERYWSDVFPRGVVVLPGGVESPAPLAYMKRCKELQPEVYEAIREQREAEALKRLGEVMPQRLQAREIVAHARADQSKRDAL